MMRRYIYSLFSFAVFILITSSCGGRNKDQGAVDSVAIGEVNVIDTTSYALSDKSQCNVFAQAHIAYPQLYKDNDKTRKLQKIFSDIVLEIPGDSIPFKESFSRFVSNALGQFGESSDKTEYDDPEREIVYKYNSVTDITVAYNKEKIIAFCRKETTMKNNAVTMVTHYYYNIDLETMTRIDLARLFADDVIGDVSELLKHKLITQLNVKDEDALIDLGYFNLDNLVANNNFCISDTGVTWTFVPYEIACLSVGETIITLDYETLRPYISESSFLSKFI